MLTHILLISSLSFSESLFTLLELLFSLLKPASLPLSPHSFCLGLSHYFLSLRLASSACGGGDRPMVEVWRSTMVGFWFQCCVCGGWCGLRSVIWLVVWLGGSGFLVEIMVEVGDWWWRFQWVWSFVIFFLWV